MSRSLIKGIDSSEEFWRGYAQQSPDRQRRLQGLMFRLVNGCQRTNRLLELYQAGQIGAGDLLSLSGK